jgi:hypothetical protein
MHLKKTIKPIIVKASDWKKNLINRQQGKKNKITPYPTI